MINSLIIRKSKKKDIRDISIFLTKNFNKKISQKYLKYKYFNEKSFSFIAIHKNKIIGHIAFVKKRISNSNLFLFSRHSSCVEASYRRNNVYTSLCTYSYKKIFLENKSNLLISWPNQHNYKVPINSLIKDYYIFNNYVIISNIFTFKKEKTALIKKRIKKFKLTKQVADKIKKYLFLYKSIFNKDFQYFKKRYISDQQFYLFEIKIQNEDSAFILNLKKNNDFYSMYLHEYLGSASLYIKSLNILVKKLSEYKIPISFWVEKNNYYLKNKFINNKFKILGDNFKIIILSHLKINKKIKEKIKKQKFFMGDTDVFDNVN